MPTARPFGTLLRQRRLLARLSQEGLAERAGLSLDAIRALERGRRAAPRPETVERLAFALGLGPAERDAFTAAALGGGMAATEPAAAAPAPGALPVPPTPLIGREREAAAVAHLLGGPARLVTITGPGGVGKTRLALRVAALARDDHPDGAAFVDLSPLRDPALVAPAIAEVLGVREVGARDARVGLLAFLRDRRMLLVLDNFEHLLAAAPLVATILERCPGVVALTTSREALGLRAEQRFRLGPLAFPEAGKLAAALAANYDAVRFFVARARAARPDFALGDENAPAVAQICRSLDGLPLALELAAARIAYLPPAALAARLDRPLALLVGGARDLPDRQRTLRAALDWSHELLTAEERTLFARLGIFAGWWTLAAAADVAGSADLFEGVASLAEQSLLRPADATEGEPRFGMLETIREYALEQLAARGETEPTARAHAGHYLALAEEAEPHFRGPAEAAWLAMLDAARDNLRAALGWYASDDPGTGLRLAAALWQFWWARGQLSEGRDWLARLLAGAPAEAPARPRALLGAGFLAMQQSDWAAARPHLEAGLALSRARGDDALTARLLRELGSLLAYSSEYAAARPLLEEALAIGRALGDSTSREESALNLARVLRSQGDFPAARALLAEALAAALARGAARSIAAVRVALGDTLRDDGDLAGAEREYAAGLAAGREVDHPGYTAWALAGLGQVALWRGEPARAEALLRDAAGLYAEIGNAHSLGFVAHMRGQAARLAGDLERAGALLREALDLRWRLGGRGGTAASLEALALIDASRGELLRAVRLLAAAAGARAAVGAPPAPLEHAPVSEAISALRAALGGAAFAAAWAEAAALPLDEIVRATLAEPAGRDAATPRARL